MVKFFDATNGIFYTSDQAAAWEGLGINVLGVFVITVWTVVWSALIFFPMKYFGVLRIDEETELAGCDIIKHGESAYPASSWQERQYDHHNGVNGHANGGTDIPVNMSSAQDMEMGARRNKGYDD